MAEPIRISRDELDDPGVDAALAREAAYRGDWGPGSGGEGEVVGRVDRRRGQPDRGKGLYLKGVVVTGLLALLGALLAWLPFEPYQYDTVPTTCVVCQRVAAPDEQWICDRCGLVQHQACWRGTTSSAGDPKEPQSCGVCGGKVPYEESTLVQLLMIPCIVAAAACFIGAADGLLSRAWSRAATSAAVGLGVGLAAGLVTSFMAYLIFGLGNVGLALTAYVFDRLDDPPGLFLGLMSVRSAAWAAFGLAAGLGPGLLQRSRDLVSVGALGGIIGGFLGGLFFDPIAELLGAGEVSRGVGFGFTGLVTGLSIGLVEQLSKDAWLYMEQGPLVGKQFVLYRDPTRIGSSPKCDIFIFKDSEVSPEHAQLRRVGATHEVEASAGAVVLVNGRRVGRQRLEDGDELRVGRARLRYYVRRRKRVIR